MPSDNEMTMRDIKFYTFAEVIAKRANWIRNKISGTASASINVEFGYGGARLMDVRWTGFKSISKLCECIYYCNNDLKLRVVGCSAGNIIVYSLAIVLAMKGKCCGFNVKNPQRRGRNINKRLFSYVSGLNIPSNITCACECIRIITDLLLETVAIQEHPAWHDEGHKLYADTIPKMFAGTETAESVLPFTRGTGIGGFSDLFVKAPVRYALSMYRAIDRLEGTVGALYTLSRFLILFCVEWSYGCAHNPFFDVCEFYIGSRKIVDDDGFVFTDLVSTDFVPLANLSPTTVLNDVERFNKSVNILIESIDVREIVLPHIARVIWRQKIKRLRLRNNKSLSDLRNWRWSGRVSTWRSFSPQDYEVIEQQQICADIMSATNHLPDFEKMIVEESNKSLCWNYVFELSPQGKHLFQLERISGLFEAYTVDV